MAPLLVDAFQADVARILENVEDGHGLAHALRVLAHAECAIAAHDSNLDLAVQVPLTASQRLAIRLAALCHDLDDRKLFEDSHHTETLLEKHDVSGNVRALVLQMIDLVPFSKNGNEPHTPEWMLFPRLADRLEAIGSVGIERCFAYAHRSGNPVRASGDPRPITLEEIQDRMDPRRMQAYLAGKPSESAIGHFYDKLLFVGDFAPQTSNPYLLKLAERRAKVMHEWLIEESAGRVHDEHSG